MDLTVKLITDTEYSSLYSWCLQEFNGDDEQVGSDLIPCVWSLEFDVTNLHYAYSLMHENTDPNRFDEDEQEVKRDRPAKEFQSSEVLSGSLVPTERRYRRASYSMVGTDREITDITFRIVKADADSCKIWGSVSYTFELDFLDEITDDCLVIQLRLTAEKFDDIARMINKGAINEGKLRLGGVQGFYSDWSPGISTDFIKVLTRSIDDHKVEIPQGAEINLPRLGAVEDFHFMLSNNHQLASGDEDNPVDDGWAKRWTEAGVPSVSADYDAEEDNTRTSELNEERAGSLRRTLKYELLLQMLREASSHGAKNNLDPDALDELAGEISDFFAGLEYTFEKHSFDDHVSDPPVLTGRYVRRWNLWHHLEIRFDKIKKGEVPYIDRESLTAAVAQYLDLPIRNRRVDRILVDALVAAEVIAFSNQMLNVRTFLRGFPTSPFANSHPLWRFIKGQFSSLIVVAAIPIGLLIGAVNLFEIRSQWPLFVGLGSVGLWALFFLSGLIALPSFWISDTKLRGKVGELINAMNTVYTEIGTGTVVSARHIRERLDKTTNQGAVWPPEVFALLDDIIDRNGVM